MSDEIKYTAERDQHALNGLDDDIKTFLEAYRKNGTIPPTRRRLLILFPGGMGATLKRATETFSAAGSPRLYSFEDFWLMLKLFFVPHAVDAIRMTGDVDDSQRFMVPRGPAIVFGHHIYSAFVSWCGRKHIDIFVLGYDWRRRPEHSVDYFLNEFFPHLLQRIADAGLPPPADITLVGHSLGGMIVKLIAHEPSPYVRQIKRFITVCTPFYGYPDHTPRFFRGVWLLGFVNKKSRIARLTASLQGGYYLQYLDLDTYMKNKDELAADPRFPLRDYPSKDADDRGEYADPFSPTAKGGLVRYPHFVNMADLASGKATYQKIAQDLPDDIAPKFYNIRAVTALFSLPISLTRVSQTWARVPPTFNPDTDKLPLKYKWAPGDHTIAAWSARLVSLQKKYPANVRTLTGLVEHNVMMALGKTRREIYQLLQLEGALSDDSVNQEVERPIAVASP